MARLAIPAIRKAITTLLGAESALAGVPIVAAPQSDVENNQDEAGGGDLAPYPYIAVGIEQVGGIESGTLGSPTRGDVGIRVLVWARRGQPGEYGAAAALADVLGDTLDAWGHEETGLRWRVRRESEIEEFGAQAGGPGLDGLGALWIAQVKYC
jgi:hypothetical protein